jgi:hypothetical protein
MNLPHWPESPDRKRDDGAVFRVGDRVRVVDQEIHGEIVRWDGGKAVVLDDDAADWMEGDDDGTLVFSLWDLASDTESQHHPRHGNLRIQLDKTV